MPDINQYLENINNAILGEDVRGSIHDAIKAINDAAIEGIEQASARVGTPVPVSTAAAMEDTSKIYLYTGEETGYTADHWYYYDGSAWTDGGAYNSPEYDYNRLYNKPKIVEISSDEPEDERTNVWFDPDGEEVEIPTMEEFESVIADEYDSTKTYSIGDFCLYNGALYECTTVIATAEAWNSAHWTLTNVGRQIGNLKEDLNDITETVYSSNIFNQVIATITEGKYLNPNTGNYGTNASFCYVNDYIPVKPATTYYGTTWNRNTLAFTGVFNGFAVFYTSDKEYISGLPGLTNQNPFTTPENCAYMRISMGTSGYNSNYYMFEEGSTRSTRYLPYSKKSMLKLPIYIVDINGNGMFASIKDAVNTLPSGSSILVMPGVYEENVKAWAKEIHIIGFNREACVLKDTSGNYSTPPLEIGAGSVENMTIIEHAEGAGTETLGAYAIHIEDNNLFNKKLLIRNCYIESDSSSAIGMGLRGGCSVRIEDCELICAGARASTGAAPIYFHDADAQAYWGDANLYLHNNVLRNTASTLFSMLTINSIHKENTTYMHMMYNIFVRSKTPSLTQKFNTWNTSGNTDADGWNGLSHMYLEDDSFGNNQTELNYAA